MRLNLHQIIIYLKATVNARKYQEDKLNNYNKKIGKGASIDSMAELKKLQKMSQLSAHKSKEGK